MVSAQLLNHEKSDLKGLAERLFHETVEKPGNGNSEFIQAAQDADSTFKLGERFENEIKQRGITELFAVEMEVMKVLASMEQTGVKIDVAWLQSIQPGYEKRIKSLRDRIWEITGEFNINSNQQLAKKLFGDMKFPVIRQTKKGNSVDAGVLEKLKKRTAHALFDLLLEYRPTEFIRPQYAESPGRDQASHRPGERQRHPISRLQSDRTSRSGLFLAGRYAHRLFPRGRRHSPAPPRRRVHSR